MTPPGDRRRTSRADMWFKPEDIPAAALGAMRLSTQADRDDERSIVALHAAFDAGVTLVDTADAYALDASETGHNERLIASAIASWRGDATRIKVATKGGLTRPEGRWVPDGRARHLMAACRASRAALGGAPIALYQLHAPDPRVAWTTSVRALAALQREGEIEAVGLCNVTVAQIAAARLVVDIAAVQVELGPWNDRSLASGVVDYCQEHGIWLLAYRPFGGVRGAARLARDAVLARIAAAHGVPPFEIVLAWLRGVAAALVPLPGATRAQTAQSCGHAHLVTLSGAERATLDAHFPLGRARAARRRMVNRDAPVAPDRGDIVMVMGLPGAGKSTLAARFVAEGYERLNRDEAGGALAAIIPALAARVEAGAPRIVLDNTYLSRASRAAVINAAAAAGRAVRGVWLDTSLEDAQVNAVWRMVRAHGRLLTPEELRGSRDPAAFAPTAQFRAQRAIEPPDVSEGFAGLEIVPFVRRHDPNLTNRALILWCDAVLRRSRSGAARPQSVDDVEVVTEGRDVLSRYAEEGWKLLALSWEPEITEKGVDAAQVEAGLARVGETLRLDIAFHYCPHAAGPPVCWCRKPLPGLGVLLLHRHQLDPSQCVYVGTTPQDPPFARRLGVQYREPEDFFGDRCRHNPRPSG